MQEIPSVVLVPQYGTFWFAVRAMGPRFFGSAWALLPVTGRIFTERGPPPSVSGRPGKAWTLQDLISALPALHPSGGLFPFAAPLGWGGPGTRRVTPYRPVPPQLAGPSPKGPRQRLHLHCPDFTHLVVSAGWWPWRAGGPRPAAATAEREPVPGLGGLGRSQCRAASVACPSSQRIAAMMLSVSAPRVRG